MTMHIRVGGVWKTVSPPSVRVAGTWRTVAAGWVRVSGTWRQFYGGSSLAASVPAGSYTHNVAGVPTDCNFVFIDTGSWSVNDNLSQTGVWKTGTGTGADYQVRWTTTSGSLDTGGSGTWNTLNANRTYGVTMNSPGTKTCTGTVEIRQAAFPNTVLATGSMTLTARWDT